MNNPTANLNLFIDLKTQDRLREWFSKRGSLQSLTLTGLALGDSEVNYKLSQQYQNIQTLSTPYEIPRIKHKLIYSGQANNLIGYLNTYLRHVDKDGNVESLYNYIDGVSSNVTFSQGQYPPVLVNGKNWNTVLFNITQTEREGFIVFTETLPDGYFDANGKKMRLREEYSFEISVLPVGWEIIIDEPNGSFLIAKPDSYSFLTLFSQIKITGKLSGISKVITFNY